MNSTTKKLLIVAGSVLAIVLVLLAIFGGGNRDKLRVGTKTVPSDSTVLLDGRPIKPNTRLYLTKGEHTFKVSRQFFTDTTVVVSTDKLEEGDIIYLLPGAETPEAVKFLNEHPDIQQEREAAGADKASAKAQAIADRYPITLELPYNALDYRVDYSLDAKDNLSLQVTLYPVATTPGTPEYINQLVNFKKEALDYLKSRSIDTKKIPVTFNPDPDK